MKFNNSKQEHDQNAEFKAMRDNNALWAVKAKSDDKAQSTSKAKSATKATSSIKAKSAAKDFVTDSTFKADPLGSYTGHSKYRGETPTQDADDL